MLYERFTKVILDIFLKTQVAVASLGVAEENSEQMKLLGDIVLQTE